jgi:DNA (cytosine-5)-methyltransferase 1
VNYYNEFDPKAAAWLRELIREGHIAPGEVDERSISEVKATDLSGFTQCHFFAGIGGWSYALRLAGWPDDQPVWTGSCPCQPFSAAGKQMGRNDPRHLWPAFRRLINRGRPPKVFGEQVASKAGRGWLAGVLSDLEIMGYAGAAADLCSAGVGSPNIRQRLFWMAEPEGKRGEGVEPQRTEGFGERPRSGCDSPDSASSLGMAYPIGERGCSGPSGSPDAGDARQPVQSANNREREREAHKRWLAYAEQQRLERHSGHEHDRNQPGRLDQDEARPASPSRVTRGFWGEFDLIYCTDGKARRVEPGVEPLAHGVSGRVGLLRGYGNAINPVLAAEFIQACEGFRSINL